MAGAANEAKKAANIKNAAVAEAHYGAGEYEKALEALRLIESNLTDKDDPRFVQNLRLVESATGGFSNVQRLRDGLLEVKKKMRAKQVAKQQSTSSNGAATDGGANAASSSSTAPPPSSATAATAANGGDKSGSGGGSSSSSLTPSLSSSSSAAAGSASSRSQTSAASTDVNETLSVLREADSDCSILLYNLAALHFERQEYGASRTILEQLFRDIEPIEETVAVYVCLLLLDALVHCSRGALLNAYDKAAFASQTEEVLGKMENLTRAGIRKDGGGGGGGGDAAGDKDKEGVASLPFSSEQASEFDFRLHLYRAKALLMQHHLKASKKEIKSALEILHKSKFHDDDKKSSGGSSGSRAGSPSRSEEWASSAPALRNMSALYLKANFEYLRQNYRKALKLLSSCHSIGQMMQQLEGPDGASSSGGSAPGQQLQAVEMKGAAGSMYYNNVACVHHKMQRSHLALHYFQKALAECGNVHDESGSGGSGGKGAKSGGGGSGGGKSGKSGGVAGREVGVGGQGRGLSTEGRPRSGGVECSVSFNAGLQLLLAGGKPAAALALFEKAVPLLHGRPNLWLRMAECCIQQFTLSQQEPRALQTPLATATTSGDAVVDSGAWWAVVGAGGQRRFLLPAGKQPPSGTVATSSSGVGGRGAVVSLQRGSCTLAYASTCLHNALFLLATHAAAKKVEAEAEGKLALFGAGSNGGGGPGNGGTGGTDGNEAGSGVSSGGSGTGGGGATEGNGGAGGTVVSLEASCLLDLAFVHLSLAEPQLALHHALRLLALSTTTRAAGVDAGAGGARGGGDGASPSPPSSPSSPHPGSPPPPPHALALAHMYAAEALCALNKPSEALAHMLAGGEAATTMAGGGEASGGGGADAAALALTPPPAPEAVSALALALAASTQPAVPPLLRGSSTNEGGGGGGYGGGGICTGSVLATCNGSEVKAVMYCNMATAFLAQAGGSVSGASPSSPSGGASAGVTGVLHQQAEKCARLAVEACPWSPHALRSLVHVLLKAGKAPEALEWLKLYRTGGTATSASSAQRSVGGCGGGR